MMRLTARAAYWAGHIQSRAAADAPTVLLCVLLLATMWGAWRPATVATTEPALEVVEYPSGVRIYRAHDKADADALADLVNAAGREE